MRFTQLKDGKYVIQKKHISLGKEIVSGIAITKLAMYEDIAPTPAQFAKVVKSAQEMLDGISFTPKQAEIVEKTVKVRCDAAISGAFDIIIKDLEENGYKDAVELLKKKYIDKED